MAWYYYSGKTVKSVPVKRGLSKSIRPHSKVEILEETIEVRALIRKGELRRTGRDKGARPVAEEKVPEKTVKEVMEPSLLAKKFAEKGKTNGPRIPPVSRTGTQMTEDELEAGKVTEVPPVGEPPKKDEEVVEKAVDEPAENAEKIDDAEELPDDSERKEKGRRKKGRR